MNNKKWKHARAKPKYVVGDVVGSFRIETYIDYAAKNHNPNTNKRTPYYTEPQHQYTARCNCGSKPEVVNQDGLLKRTWCMECSKRRRIDAGKGVKPPLAQAVKLWPVPDSITTKPECY